MLSTVLRIKRTLDGAEIDKIISDVEAGKALATERRRLCGLGSYRQECCRIQTSRLIGRGLRGLLGLGQIAARTSLRL